MVSHTRPDLTEAQFLSAYGTVIAGPGAVVSAFALLFPSAAIVATAVVKTKSNLAKKDPLASN